MLPSLIRRLTAGALAATLALLLPAMALAESAVPLEKGQRERLAEPQATEPKVTETQALARLQRFFPVPENSEDTVVKGELTTYLGRMVWEFEVYGTRTPLGAEIGTVDAMTGMVVSYVEPWDGPKPIPLGPRGTARSQADAEAVAWRLVQRLYPELAGSLRPREADAKSSGEYRFVWNLHHQSVPVYGDDIVVEIDGMTMAVTRLHASITPEAHFPTTPVTVSLAEATAQFHRRLKPYLFYRSDIMGSLMSGHVEAHLRYDVDGLWDSLNAVTGEWRSETEGWQPTSAPPAPLPLGTKPPVSATVLPLTAETGRLLAAAILGVPAEQLTRETAAGVPESVLVYSTEQGNGVALLRETGAIVGARRIQPEWTDEKPSDLPHDQISPEREAADLQVAVDLAQRYFGQYAAQLRLPQRVVRLGSTVQYRFGRVKDGIPVEPDYVEITVDPVQKTWVDMLAVWTPDKHLPAASAAIPPEEALRLIMANRRVVLRYEPVESRAMLNHRKEAGRPVEMQLVYVLDPQVWESEIDALTGQPVGAAGLTDLAEAEDRSLTGHWAEGQLRYMVDRGVLPAEELSADGQLTISQAKAMMEWAGISFVGDYPVTPVWAPAEVQREHDPVTRAQMAVWAVRSLGLGDLARSTLATTASFTDLGGLPAEARNAAAFLEALGLLSPGPAFRGSEAMTQAEGATLAARLYNYRLKKWQQE